MIDKYTAATILERVGVPFGADFHTLDSDTVERLLVLADTFKYRKPKNANGSRGRYWHAYLQRRAMS